jgi:hypothetical protein
MSAKKRNPLLRAVRGAGLGIRGPAGYFLGAPHHSMGKGSPGLSTKVLVPQLVF